MKRSFMRLTANAAVVVYVVFVAVVVVAVV